MFEFDAIVYANYVPGDEDEHDDDVDNDTGVDDDDDVGVLRWHDGDDDVDDVDA